MIAPVVNESSKTFGFFLAFLGLTFTGNYVEGGDTLDLTKIPQNTGDVSNFLVPPKTCEIIGGNLGGYTAAIVPGATLQTYKVQIFNGDTELAAGAYPAAILNGRCTALATRTAF